MSLRRPIGGDDRPLTPPGNHPARLCQVVDLGIQPDEKYGPKPKIRFTFELLEEKEDFGKGVQEPFLISRETTVARGKKAVMPKLIEGVLGRPITNAEYDNIEPLLKNLLGSPCLVNVIHAKVGERTFVNIENVTPMLARMKKDMPPLVNKAIYFATEMGPTSKEFEALPDFLKARISQCAEWNASSKILRATVPPPPDEPDKEDDGQQELNFG